MNRDQLVAARYPNSKIYRLSAKRKRTGVQKILKYLRFAYVDSPACITENLVDDIGWKFYMLHEESKYHLVAVSGQTVKTQMIGTDINLDEFEYGGWIFTNSGSINNRL